MEEAQDSVPVLRDEELAQILPTPQEAVELLRLLLASDTFPRGGLYNGYYCMAAALRYEVIWLQVLREYGANVVPPLDVSLVWLVHRQFPISYGNTMMRRCKQPLHPPSHCAFAFGIDACAETWKAVADDHPVWPPPLPGSEHDLEGMHVGYHPALACQLAAAMPRFGWLLRSWLRPHFLDEEFLERAKVRYSRFLRLMAENPSSTLVPTADIALMWHTHLGLSDRYLDACELMQDPRPLSESGSAMDPVSEHAQGGGGGAGATGAETKRPPRERDSPGSVHPWRPTYLEMDLDGDDVQVAYGNTARLYEATYGEPYVSPDTAWLPSSEIHPLESPTSPVALALVRGFDCYPSPQASHTPLSHPGGPVLRNSYPTSRQRPPSGSFFSMSDTQLGNPRLSPTGRRLSPPTPSAQQLTAYYNNHLFQSPRTQGGRQAPATSQLPRTSPSYGGLSVRPSTLLSPVSAHSLSVVGPPPVLRAGGHALYAAWLGGTAALKFYDRQTCHGACFRKSWSIKAATVENMVTPLVHLSFLCNTVDSNTHPFLVAVRLRKGLWKQPPSDEEGEGAGAEKQGQEEQEGAEAGRQEPQEEEQQLANKEEQEIGDGASDHCEDITLYPTQREGAKLPEVPDPPESPNHPNDSNGANDSNGDDKPEIPTLDAPPAAESPPLVKPQPQPQPKQRNPLPLPPLLSAQLQHQQSERQGRRGADDSSEGSVFGILDGAGPGSRDHSMARRVCFFSPFATTFSPADAETFLDDPAMAGLGPLLEARAAWGDAGEAEGPPGSTSKDGGDDAQSGGGAAGGRASGRKAASDMNLGASGRTAAEFDFTTLDELDEQDADSEGAGDAGGGSWGRSASARSVGGNDAGGGGGGGGKAPPAAAVPWWRRLLGGRSASAPPPQGTPLKKQPSRSSGGKAGGGGVPGATPLPAPTVFRPGDAPIWCILHEPLYARRAVTYYEYLWQESVKRGIKEVPPSR